jgi:molecular chaperone DnaK (HSP70)
MNTIGIDFGTGNTVLAEWYGTQSKIFEQVGSNGLVSSDVAIDLKGQVYPQPVQDLQNLSEYKIEKFIKRKLLNALEEGNQKAIAYLTELAALRLKYIMTAIPKQAPKKLLSRTYLSGQYGSGIPQCIDGNRQADWIAIH